MNILITNLLNLKERAMSEFKDSRSKEYAKYIYDWLIEVGARKKPKPKIRGAFLFLDNLGVSRGAHTFHIMPFGGCDAYQLMECVYFPETGWEMALITINADKKGCRVHEDPESGGPLLWFPM